MGDGQRSHGLITPQLSNSNLTGIASIDDEEDARMKAENEVREFLEEQISQVFSVYVQDYFDGKEILYVKQVFVNDLRRVVVDSDSKYSMVSKVPTPLVIDRAITNDHCQVNAGSIFTMPKLQAGKIKSVSAILNTVANKKYISGIFDVIADSIHRIGIIETDDRRRASNYKDIFVLLLGRLLQYSTETFRMKMNDRLLVGWYMSSVVPVVYSNSAQVYFKYECYIVAPVGISGSARHTVLDDIHAQ